MLHPSDPPPFQVFGSLYGPFLLSCEHAGNAIPAALGDLGLPRADLDDHIGWDPGALAVAKALSRLLGACLVAQPFSRLVIDCNRPEGAPDLFPSISDGRRVSGNSGLNAVARRARWDEIHRPFHEALAKARLRHRALVSIHSFTPRLQSGQARRTQIGVLARDGNPLFRHVMAALPQAWPGPVAANDPYEIEDASDYTIPVHAEAHGMPHALIEVRNDLIADPAGVGRVATALAGVLKGFNP